MNWKSMLVILGAAAATAALGNCPDEELRTYLGANGRMYKWQEQVGKAMGDADLRVRGHAKEFEGKAQKKLGDMKEIAREDLRDVDDDDRPLTGDR